MAQPLANSADSFEVNLMDYPRGEKVGFQRHLQDPDPFLFGPESETWRINCERCGLIFGPAAAILQVAHPRIAQGVYDHSNFRRDTIGRLRRTLESTNRITFGRSSEAKVLSAQLAAMHQRVRGTVSAGIGGRRVYSASEPELLLWVFATLISAAVNGYEFIHGKLPVSRKEAFYREARRFGECFGVSASLSPKRWRAFEAYYKEMVEGDLLGSHWMCRELANAVVYPRDSTGTRLLGNIFDFVAIETLPLKLRDRLGLRSTISTRFRMRLTRAVLPKLFRFLPRRLRFHSEYLRAVRTLVS